MSAFDFAAKPKAKVERQVFIKRRNQTTGKYESEWLNVTDDVINFGKIKKSIDATRPYKFRFSTVNTVFANESGRYNSHENESSLWFGFLNQQRTLFKYECSFQLVSTLDNGQKIVSNAPGQPKWDGAIWDESLTTVWDGTTSSVFTGVLSGDISVNDSNKVSVQVKPLYSVFEDYPASRLDGWTTTGMTGSQFIEMIRDQTDGAGEFVFRPFFGDTTSNWIIQTTTSIYPDLTDSATDQEDITTSNVWEIIEKICEAENFVPYVSGDGKFYFVSRTSIDSLSAYEFHGAGSFSTQYGNTIKKVDNYGFKISKFYSRVQLKFKKENTSTSYFTKQSAFEVSGANNPWVLGDKTLQIQNTFVQNTTTAENLVNNLFDDVSGLKNELGFRSSLVLGIDLFDRFKVFYDPTEVNARSLWDVNDWGDASQNENHLFWDKPQGEQVNLTGDEFKFLSFEIDLDKLENKFIAREV